MQATEIELTEPQRLVLEAFAGGGVELSPEPSAREVFKELRELGLLRVNGMFSVLDEETKQLRFYNAYRRTAKGMAVWLELKKRAPQQRKIEPFAEGIGLPVETFTERALANGFDKVRQVESGDVIGPIEDSRRINIVVTNGNVEAAWFG